MSYVVHITKNGIAVFDGASLINRSNAEAVFHFTRNAADDVAPIIEGGLDTDATITLIKSANSADYNAITRETVAGTLGILAGAAAIPFGPAIALATGEVFAESFTYAYDKVSSWSADQDWSPVFNAIEETIEILSIGATTGIINSSVNAHFIASLTNPPPPRDPLVLDLDGDGIEAVPIDPAAPTLFDHNADGTRTATGWIKPDDGFVVLDLDGNGTIDSGRELFGDNTLLPSGQLARNGFEAIVQHDANADGHIDTADAVFEQLQIWRDLNADGISQQGELSTLAASDIASINVAGTASNLNLGGGNVQAFSGSFTRTDGAEGTSGVANLSGSLLFAANNFYREFTDDPPLSDVARTLPQMHGSGWVRDLREAMSLGTPEATALQDAVTAFAASDSRMEQRGELLYELIRAWAETSGQMRQGTSSAGNDVLLRTLALEVFNGARFPQLRTPESSSGNTIPVIDGDPAGGALGALEFISTTAWQFGQLAQAWDALAESVYAALVVQTRLKPYLDSIALVIDEHGIRLDASGISQRLAELHGTDPLAALGDVVDLWRYCQDTLSAVGHFPELIDTVRQWAQSADAEELGWMNAMNISFGDALTGTAANQILLGASGNDSISAGGGDDLIDGGAGDDQIRAGTGDDLLLGGAGDDQLFGEDGQDTLDGGEGNDYLSGGSGNDTYVWSSGRGDDRISEQGNRPSATEADTVILEGLNPADVQLTSNGNADLTVRVIDTGETLFIELGMREDYYEFQQIERLQFADGTVWGLQEIRNAVVQGTDAAEHIWGTEGADDANGLDGNDRIWTRGGNDTIDAGDGNDQIRAGNGDDLLLGGAGDD